MGKRKLKLILLVDDDTVASYLHQTVIEDMNITERIQLARDGLEALLFLKDLNEDECCPDLILLDLKMPVLDGFEFLDLYNHMDFRRKDSIKIVVLSSSQRNDDWQRVLHLGAVDYMVKPLSEIKLSHIVEKHF